MNDRICVALCALLGLLVIAGCGAATPTAAPAPTATAMPSIVLAGGYRPLQTGDNVEGATIDYQYILPSPDKPTLVIAFGQQMLTLVQVNPEMSDGLVAYMSEVLAQSGSVLAFDEADPQQDTPKAITFDKTRPVEIAFIPLTEGQHAWSAFESAGGETHTAYKIIRRRDGGLRFVDAYDIVVLQSYNNIITRLGNGTGLGFSARLAQLKMILAGPAYQFGANPMQARPPDITKYDPRVLKVDTNKTGLDMNVAWVLLSRNAPSPIPIGN
ncbi:MAG: hypothetical protein HZB53_17110 [Chloroflexi bacterium]|nr:hypothetical protein [Chloroflexota bacterium]